MKIFIMVFMFVCVMCLSGCVTHQKTNSDGGNFDYVSSCTGILRVSPTNDIIIDGETCQVTFHTGVLDEYTELLTECDFGEECTYIEARTARGRSHRFDGRI